MKTDLIVQEGDLNIPPINVDDYVVVVVTAGMLLPRMSSRRCSARWTSSTSKPPQSTPKRLKHRLMSDSITAKDIITMKKLGSPPNLIQCIMDAVTIWRNCKIDCINFETAQNQLEKDRFQLHPSSN